MHDAQTIRFDGTMVLDEDDLEILPNGWYSDETAFELEQQEAIAPTWQYVGPAGLVSKPGRYMTAQIGRLPVIVARDGDGKLNAMANVCQHRGSTIVEDKGFCRSFRCPYHGWTYDLDGTLMKAVGHADDIDREAFSLPKLSVTEWGPLVFVAPATMSESIGHYFDPLPARLKETGLKWDSLHLRDRRTWEIKANWKVVTENYIECYHCGFVHADYSKYVDMNNYSWEYGQFYEAQAGPAHPAALREGYLTETDAIKDGLFIHVWPNLHLQVYPGDAQNLSVLQILPLAPGRTLALLDHYFGDDAAEDEADRITEMFSEQLEEDWAICEKVHEGLMSGAYRAGKLNMDDYRAGRLNLNAPAGRTEEPIRHFHRLLHKALTARHSLQFDGQGNGGNGGAATGNGHSPADG
jgi:phenylpropionate dioxygenase-like ring-hydroxylating dioxygenase large terminal subunit